MDRLHRICHWPSRVYMASAHGASKRISERLRSSARGRALVHRHERLVALMLNGVCSASASSAITPLHPRCVSQPAMRLPDRLDIQDAALMVMHTPRTLPEQTPLAPFKHQCGTLRGLFQYAVCLYEGGISCFGMDIRIATGGSPDASAKASAERPGRHATSDGLSEQWR